MTNFNLRSFNSVNTKLQEAVFQHFRDGIGRKVFCLTPGFPFLLIGVIREVIDDMVIINVETTHSATLEDREWILHIDSIEVFYIERDDGPTIPILKE